MKPLYFLNVDIEETCHVRGEVILRHLKEQLVLVGLVRIVCQQEYEVGVTVVRVAFLLGRILIVEFHASPSPYFAQVEFTYVEAFAGIYTIDNHTCHLAESAIWVFVYHFFKVNQAAIDIAIIQLAETSNKEELVSVCSIREAGLGYFGIVYHLIILSILESLIGMCIERILDMDAHYGILLIVRIGEKDGPLTSWVICLQLLQVCCCHICLMLSGIEQIQVIISIVKMLIIRIVVDQSEQGFLTQCQIVELILEDNTGMIQTVFQQSVAFCQLFWSKRNLSQIILTLMWVIDGAVCGLLE